MSNFSSVFIKSCHFLAKIWKFERKYLILQRILKKGDKSMATPIRPIPVVTGDDAVRFVEAAEAAERNPHTVELEMSREDFNKIMQTAELY